ncbi:MAG: coproporphyrinogen III oxidase family protein [Bryobacteraceae bacterium]|nr:coproporphyrinogen III oxidase family protein [Bryobacteraceae bacterium]
MAGVYISWPFCAQKCTYCNFASGVFPRELEDRYLRALLSELTGTGWSWTPQTVYLWGGTPGSMTPDQLRDVLTAVPGRPWKEATLEAAPGAITPGGARAWLECGSNRGSRGVQSFVESELRRTGRRHTAEGVACDVALLRAAGFAEINIDLIAGLPGQTEASWRASLDWIERLGPPHVSVYMLEVDEDSRLGRELLAQGRRFGALDVPSGDATAEFYEIAVERLAALGLERYEISNFARRGSESLHNLKYWQLEPYLGFGADAHSFDGRLRWQNAETALEYVERHEAGLPLRCETTEADIAGERFWVGLRLLRGIAPPPSERASRASAIARLVNAGLLEDDGAILRLTPRGVLLSNEVFEAFL